MKTKANSFESTAFLNNATYNDYFNRIFNLSTARFKWNNLPDSINTRYLEQTLFYHGSCIVFRDEIIGMLALPMEMNGNFDVYGDPIERIAYSTYNHYRKRLNRDNSVIIYNNYSRVPTVPVAQLYATRFSEVERAIDVNVKGQKTPKIIQCPENKRLTLKNLYMQYDGNTPFIFGDKNLDLQGITVLDTSSPYISDKLFALKSRYWSDLYTFLGIQNAPGEKKERVVTGEVDSNLGATTANRLSWLNARRDAVEKINAMFNTNISVDFAEEYTELQKAQYNLVEDSPGEYSPKNVEPEGSAADE